MSTQPLLPFTADRIQRHRDSKRQQIERMFASHIGQKFSSAYLHAAWGSAVRTRISDINHDEASEIRILNHTDFKNGKEISDYWAEKKQGGQQ